MLSGRVESIARRGRSEIFDQRSSADDSDVWIRLPIRSSEFRNLANQAQSSPHTVQISLSLCRSCARATCGSVRIWYSVTHASEHQWRRGFFTGWRHHVQIPGVVLWPRSCMRYAMLRPIKNTKPRSRVRSGVRADRVSYESFLCEEIATRGRTPETTCLSVVRSRTLRHLPQSCSPFQKIPCEVLFLS